MKRASVRAALIVALTMVLVGLSAPAQALTNFDNAPNGAHYAQGSAEPVCTFNAATATLSCTGTQIAGVGNTNADLVVSVTSEFTGVCRNPGTNRKVVDPFTETESATIPTTLTPSRNGRLGVPSRTVNGTSEGEFLANFDCPNPNWEADVSDVNISWSYTLTFAGFGAPAISISG